MTNYIRVTDDVRPSRHYSIVEEAFDESIHKLIKNDHADDQAADPLTGEPCPTKFLSSTPSGQQAGSPSKES